MEHQLWTDSTEGYSNNSRFEKLKAIFMDENPEMFLNQGNIV